MQVDGFEVGYLRAWRDRVRCERLGSVWIGREEFSGWISG